MLAKHGSNRKIKIGKIWVFFKLFYFYFHCFCFCLSSFYVFVPFPSRSLCGFPSPSPSLFKFPPCFHHFQNHSPLLLPYTCTQTYTSNSTDCPTPSVTHTYNPNIMFFSFFAVVTVYSSHVFPRHPKPNHHVFQCVMSCLFSLM